MARRKEQHEQRESFGDEAVEHGCHIGTRTPDQCVKHFAFTGNCAPKKR